MARKEKVGTICLTCKDRFVRFGYDWFDRFCSKVDTRITIWNDPDFSPQQEMGEDLVSIIHVVGSRIDGLRKYKKKIEEDEHVNIL